MHDLSKAREFYRSALGCSEGRSSTTWIDFNLYGHQLVCHLNTDMDLQTHSNPVVEHDVPVPHFGVVLNMDEWEELAQRLKDKNLDFIKTILIADDKLFLFSDAGFLLTFELQNGNLISLDRILKKQLGSRPVFSEGNMYLFNKNSQLFKFE